MDWVSLHRALGTRKSNTSMGSKFDVLHTVDLLGCSYGKYKASLLIAWTGMCKHWLLHTVCHTHTHTHTHIIYRIQSMKSSESWWTERKIKYDEHNKKSFVLLIK